MEKQLTYQNDTAFPADTHVHPGLTKREYFAAMALQGLCANAMFAEGKPSTLSATAVNVADALIKALNQ